MGVFLALDLFLFYVFFEVMLLPMYFLIAVWGGENREYAAVKFLLYTLFGSVFILVAILALYFWPGDAGLGRVRRAARSTWCAVTGAAGDRLLRAVGAGLGLPPAAGRVRGEAPLVPVPHLAARRPRRGPDADQHDPGRRPAQGRRLRPGPARLATGPGRGAEDSAAWPSPLGVVSILYGALLAMAQTDFKKLVAYSSVSHMGYVTARDGRAAGGADARSTPSASTARCS